MQICQKETVGNKFISFDQQGINLCIYAGGCVWVEKERDGGISLIELGIYWLGTAAS